MAEEKVLEIESCPARLYAIGDIHGCQSELAIMLDFLLEEEEFSPEDILVFIGDYIDRGASSREVVDTLVSLKHDFPHNVIFLRGNHEDMFLDFMGFEGSQGQSYLVNGGMECMRSYEASAPYCGEEIQEELPIEHLEFYVGLQRYVIIGDFVFVHAGLNPLRDLRFQLNEDIFWIRDEFLSNMHYFKKTVVFGHTPYEDVLFHLPYKIGIDTGLVYGGRLSCVELTKEEVFQVERGEEEVERSTFRKKGGRWPGV